MLRQRVPSALVMMGGLLLLMWLDHWLATRPSGGLRADTLGWALLTSPGVVMLLGLLVPMMWLASRELGVLLHAEGIGSGPRGRVIFAGAAAGLALAVWPGAVLVVNEVLGGVRDLRSVGLQLLWGLGLSAVLLGWGLLWTRRARKSAMGTIHAVAAMGFGFVFLGLLMGSWFWTRVWVGPVGLACAVAVIKSCDVGAYFTGRFLGKRKLIVWLSPGKTWEGLVGGMALAAAVCWALEPWWVGGLERSVWVANGPDAQDGGNWVREAVAWPWWYSLVVGAALGYVGQLGDLFASAMKRDAGVKDFARTIPGFGGVMDVIDSLLLAGPVVLLVVWLGWVL